MIHKIVRAKNGFIVEDGKETFVYSEATDVLNHFKQTCDLMYGRAFNMKIGDSMHVEFQQPIVIPAPPTQAQ